MLWTGRFEIVHISMFLHFMFSFQWYIKLVFIRPSNTYGLFPNHNSASSNMLEFDQFPRACFLLVVEFSAAELP
jgi:hypothetical protein